MRTWCLLALGLAVPAWAHEPDDEEAESPVDAGVIEPVRETTVRASRPAHAASETVVGRDVIDAAPRSGATDLLRLVPGVVASQHSGEGKAQQLFLRGFDAVHGQDVELNVGGLPVNQSSHIHALGYADLNWLIPALVREVKVMEGSGRAFQGDFAVAGTVRYELGLDEPGFTAAVGTGSFQRNRVFLGFRPASSEQTFAALEYVQGDGVGTGRDFERISAIAQAVFQLDHLKLRGLASTYGTRFSSPGVVRLDALEPGDASFFQAFGAGQGGTTSRHQVLLSAEVAHDGSRTALEGFAQALDQQLKNNFTGFLRDPEGDGLTQAQSTRTLGLRFTHARHVHLLDHLFALEAGASVKRDDLMQSQRSYRERDGAEDETQFESTIGQTLLSGWAEVAWAPEGWRLMVGGRVDGLAVVVDGRDAIGGHAGLKIGIERALGQRGRLFLNYGDGFRTPHARQLSRGELAPFVEVHGGELGAKVDFERWSARALGFGSFVGDDFFFDHGLGTSRFIGPTLRLGGQLGVTARPVDGFLISLDFTGAWAQRLETRSLLPYFAPVVARLDSSWSRPLGSFGGWVVTPTLGVGATLLGPRPLLYGAWSQTVFLVDARVGVRVGALELVLDVQNALDSRWRDGEFVFASNGSRSATASALPTRHFTAGAPRTLMLTLEVHL